MEQLRTENTVLAGQVGEASGAVAAINGKLKGAESLVVQANREKDQLQQEVITLHSSQGAVSPQPGEGLICCPCCL